MFSRSTRVWLTLLAFGTAFWLGGLLFRALIANEFFVPGTLDYLPDISFDQERVLFQLISAASTTVLICYSVVFVSSVFVLKLLPLKLKEHGWLLMAAILFYLFFPVEIFTGILDVKFILLWQNTKDIFNELGYKAYAEHSTLMRETLSHRIGALGGLPVIATLCYFTALVVIIWRPLRHRTEVSPASSE